MIDAVLVFTGSFLAPASVPYESLLIAREVYGIVPEISIRLPSAAHVSLHCAQRKDGGIVEDNDTGHGIGAVHQRGGTFHDFHGMDAFAIHFHAMLITPLLAFLTDTVVDDKHTVVTQSTDDGFGNATARADLGNTGLFGNGINDV